MTSPTGAPDDPEATRVQPPAGFGAPDPLGATTPIAMAARMAPPTEAMPKPAAAPPPPPKSALARRIFLAVAGTVVLTLVITLAVASVTSKKSAEAGIDDGLHKTAELIEELLTGQENALRDKANIYVASPIFRAFIEAATDSGNFLDAAVTMDSTIGSSWVQLTDRNGIRLARSDQPGAPAADLSESPLVSGALNGERPQGFGLTSDTVLFDAVGIAITGAGTGAPVGVAMLARNISDSTANRIQELTGSQVVFFSIDSLDNVHVVGISDSLGTDRAATAGILKQLIMSDPEHTGKTGKVGDMMMAMSSSVDATGMMRAQDGQINGRTYVWAMKALQTANKARVVGGVVALRDKDAALGPYKALQKFVLLSGLIALALAGLIATGVARQIAQPVRILVAATRRAAEGDYNAEIPESKGEIGALADAFKVLLADLREKQSLVDFLQSPASGRTRVGAAAGSTAPRGGGTATMDGSGEVAMLQAGQILANRYDIKRVLGAGGMGMVYKAFDRELGETVAIKTLRMEIMGQDPTALDRFRSEIRLARRISHRNVVRTHDIGESGGLYFITMEFVEGSALKDLILSRGRLPGAAVISIGKQLCRALEVAHEAGVIHRDIKPQNMVVESDGTVKVMDFGIARLQKRSSEAGHTQQGMVVGTPDYMSPEQLRGDELDGRSDIYSAAVALYESVTGKLPFIADTPITLIGKVLSEIPSAPRAMVADVSPALSAAIMQGLSKDRDQRPRTALEFLTLLERA